MYPAEKPLDKEEITMELEPLFTYLKENHLSKNTKYLVELTLFVLKLFSIHIKHKLFKDKYMDAFIWNKFINNYILSPEIFESIRYNDRECSNKTINGNQTMKKAYNILYLNSNVISKVIYYAALNEPNSNPVLEPDSNDVKELTKKIAEMFTFMFFSGDITPFVLNITTTQIKDKTKNRKLQWLFSYLFNTLFTKDLIMVEGIDEKPYIDISEDFQHLKVKIVSDLTWKKNQTELLEKANEYRLSPVSSSAAKKESSLYDWASSIASAGVSMASAGVSSLTSAFSYFNTGKPEVVSKPEVVLKPEVVSIPVFHEAKHQASEKHRGHEEYQAHLEAERQARKEAERLALVEAERHAREERRARLEAERLARLEAEQKARVEHDASAAVDAKREARLQARKEAERKEREAAARASAAFSGALLEHRAALGHGSDSDSESEKEFDRKYLKYKAKYLALKKLYRI